jgi:hypothetical protein
MMARRRKPKNDKKLAYILVLAIALLAFGIAVSVFAALPAPSNTEQFDMYLTVGDHAGFNIGTSAIFFGTVTPGGQSTRTIVITNYANVTTRVELQASGELAAFVSFSASGFSLASGENRTTSVTATTTENMPYGNYTGKLMILYFR